MTRDIQMQATIRETGIILDRYARNPFRRIQLAQRLFPVKQSGFRGGSQLDPLLGHVQRISLRISAIERLIDHVTDRTRLIIPEYEITIYFEITASHLDMGRLRD